MVRIGATADLHLAPDGTLDNETGADRRLTRLTRAWHWVCRDAIDRGCRYFLFCGDAFVDQHPEPQQYVALLSGFRMLIEADIKVLIAPGNHDWELAMGLSHALAPLGILDKLGVYVMDRPAMKEVDGIQFVAFPHPHRRAFDTATLDRLKETPIEKRTEAVSRAMQEIIEAYGERHRGAIALGHITTFHAEIASERYMALGWDVAVPPSSFANFSVAALGHIHRFQMPAQNVVYTGPADRLGYGDEHAPGYVTIDVEPSRMDLPPTIEHHPYPDAMHYLTFRAESPDEWPTPERPFYARIIGVSSPQTRDLYERLVKHPLHVQVDDRTDIERHDAVAIPGVTSALGPIDALRLYAEKRPAPPGAEDALRELLESE